MSERHVEIAEHLWLVLETMARDMGTDTRSLVNQAVFNWARRNGYPVMSMALAAVDTPVVREPPRPEPDLPVPAPEVPEIEASAAELGAPILASGEPTADVRAPLSNSPAPQPIADESTRAIDPDSPAAALLQTRGAMAALSIARNAAAARIVAIDRALDEVLPTTGRMSRARTGVSELDSTSIDVSQPVDTSSNQILELHVEGRSDTVIVDAAPITIGRARHCGLVIESPQVSREHAVITKVNTSYILEDKGSANGTFIGDQQVHRHELRDGDICRIGTANVLVSIRANSHPRSSTHAARR